MLLHTSEIADFRGAYLKNPDFEKANLKNVDFGGTEFSQQTNLKEANLSGVDLDGVSLGDYEYDEETVWPEDFKPRPQKIGPRRISVTSPSSRPH